MLIKRLPKWYLRSNHSSYSMLARGYVVDRLLNKQQVIRAVKTEPAKAVPPMAFPGGNRCLIGNALVNRYSIQFTHIRGAPVIRVK